MKAVSRPRVSVIIPAFRAAATLREAVESCLSQTVGSLEVLVIEDGSNDDTFEVAKTCEASDPHRVRVLQHPDSANHGVAAARNRGIDAACGDTIAFLDADDAWLPHKLESQLDVLTKQPEVGFVFSDVLISVEPDPTRPMVAQDPRPDPFRADMAAQFNASPDAALKVLCLHPEPYRFIPSPTPLVRRGMFEGSLRFVGKPALCLQYEDFLMWRVLAARTQVHCLQEPLAIYRMHSANFTSGFVATGTPALHLIALEQVQDLFMEECGGKLPIEFIRAMHAQQGARLIDNAHRIRWRDMSRVTQIAQRYGMGTQLIKRRAEALLFDIRAAISAVLRGSPR